MIPVKSFVFTLSSLSVPVLKKRGYNKTTDAVVTGLKSYVTAGVCSRTGLTPLEVDFFAKNQVIASKYIKYSLLEILTKAKKILKIH